MKIFVTGASGFIGKHFLMAAKKSGYKIKAICRPGAIPNSQYEFVEWLPINMDGIEVQHMQDCDAFVHFAAVGVSPKVATREEMIYWNVLVPQLLLEKGQRAGVRRFVMAGTFAEYGLTANSYEFIPPTAALLPVTTYASSKAASFVTSFATAVETNIELCYLRIFSAFGEGQFGSNFWPSLCKHAKEGRDFEMTLGEQIRDFISVEEVAESFLYALNRNDVMPGVPIVYNVGSGNPISIKKFAEDWWAKLNAKGALQIGKVAYRSNEIMRFVPLIKN